MLKIALLYVFLNCALQFTFGQVPNCADFIKFENTAHKRALVKGPQVKFGHMEFRVTYTYAGDYNQQLYGTLNPIFSEYVIHELMEYDIPLAYIHKFPVDNPHVTRVEANGVALCTAADIHSTPLTRVTDSHQMTISNRNSFNKPQTSQNLAEVCGQEVGTASITPLIYGGTALRRGQFPWLTAIYRKTVEGLRFLCGGTLISSRMVISAAHCFKLSNLSADRVMVILGRNNLTNFMEEDIVMRDIKRLHINPEYKTEKFHDADIALLELSNAVVFTDYIRPICMWSEPTELNRIAGKTEGAVAGWGSDGDGNYVTQLPKYVPVNIVSNEVCLRSSPVFNALTSERTLCAGKRDDTGPCKGDSGGGLIIHRNGRWVLRGIVSSGLTRAERCDLQEYTVYCDVAKHMTWVNSNN